MGRAACLLSDIGSYDHPEYRAEQTYLRVLRMQGVGFDHQARAFVALTLAVRYEAELGHDFLQPSRLLLTAEDFQRALVLGLVLRLAYTVCGGTEELLDGTWIKLSAGEVTLHLARGRGVVRGESVRRRLDRLAEALALPARIEEAGTA